MQRSVTLLAVVVALGGVACEDGPDQTFLPAPPNAGSIWNGADAGSAVGVATSTFDASVSGGQNADQRCNAVVAKNTWTKYFSEPIAPPGLGGGLDVAGGVNGDGQSGYQGSGTLFSYDPNSESWSGMTVLQAEDILCQGQYVAVYYEDLDTLSWGENNEFGVQYNADNLVITDLLFQTGYIGTFNATSRDGTTSYAISLTNQPITKTVKGGGSSKMFLPWDDTTAMSALVNELYDAYLATYAPTFPPDVDCIGAGHCGFQNNLSQGGNINFVPLGSTLFVGSTVGSQESVSIVNLVDLQKLKVFPFSGASVQLQLDSAGVGPFALASNVSGTDKTCKYTLGMPFSLFDANCVQVEGTADGGAATNATQEKKLFGSIAHDNETFAFDVVGVDPQFSATVAPGTIVSDTQRPAADDTSIILTIDQSLLGPVANDYTDNDTTKAKDLHGIGLITLEWANLVQRYMQANYGVTAQLGDAECIKNPAAPGTAGKVCSGIEGIVTSAPPSLVPAYMSVNALGAGATNVDSNLAIGLKPTTWFSVFCSGTGKSDGNGYTGCIGGSQGFGGAGAFYFDTMQDAVATSFGTKPIPAQLTDRRFFFEEWCLALIKYLKTADKPQTPLIAAAGSPSIDANVVDPNELFFDSAGEGFENAEYVDRTLVNPLKQAPTTVTIVTNLLTSVISSIEFKRYLYRSETALYEALTTTKGDLPGSENMLLSNMTGSPVLQSVYGTYACAINEDPKQCEGVLAPLDGFGAPLFAPYQAAFGQSFLHIAANGSPFTPSPMTVVSAPYTFLASAMVSMPQWTNPYDPTTATSKDPIISALSDYFPLQPYTGFPVLLDGSRDKFYPTYEVDLPGTTAGGSTVQGNVDYEYETVTTGDGGTEQALVIRAIETPNYLGLVFPCAEPSSTTPGVKDVLSVRMYDNADVILDWIAAHPGAISDCSIFFKRSIYGNYFDFISFNTSGVRFGLNPGYGGSVVSDVTVFDPNIIPGLGL